MLIIQLGDKITVFLILLIFVLLVLDIIITIRYYFRLRESTYVFQDVEDLLNGISESLSKWHGNIANHSGFSGSYESTNYPNLRSKDLIKSPAINIDNVNIYIDKRKLEFEELILNFPYLKSEISKGGKESLLTALMEDSDNRTVKENVLNSLF